MNPAQTALLDRLREIIEGETVPGKLPRSRMVPATLRLGFTSEAASTPITPELTAIRLEVSRNLTFQTAGLPSCPIAELYSESSDAGQVCAGSLVGYGIVISEVTLPGQAPVTIEGHLSAFYDLGEGQPRILAQVTSTGPLPLTYVIPVHDLQGSWRLRDDPIGGTNAVHRGHLRARAPELLLSDLHI